MVQEVLDVPCGWGALVVRRPYIVLSLMLLGAAGSPGSLYIPSPVPVDSREVLERRWLLVLDTGICCGSTSGHSLLSCMLLEFAGGYLPSGVVVELGTVVTPPVCFRMPNSMYQIKSARPCSVTSILQPTLSCVHNKSWHKQQQRELLSAHPNSWLPVYVNILSHRIACVTINTFTDASSMESLLGEC